jgi:hypothetical protein
MFQFYIMNHADREFENCFTLIYTKRKIEKL